MKAIIYTSNTGSTAHYAKMLSQELGIPAYSISKIQERIVPGSDIIYFGWLMAGSIKGYSKVKKNFNVRAVCAVGMGQTGTQKDEVRAKNKIPNGTPLFTLQGNFDIKKLHGLYKMMMLFVMKTAGKALAKKENRTPEEEDMLEMMINGTNRVKKQNLTEVMEWYLK